MYEGVDRVYVEEQVMETLRGVLIDFSLDTGNEELFNRLMGSDWERFVVVSSVDSGLGSYVFESSEDVELSWEKQLLNTMLGEFTYSTGRVSYADGSGESLDRY